MKKNLLLLGTSLLTGLILSEILLRIFTPYPIHTLKTNSVKDPILGHIIKPDLKEIDENGFRNAKIIARPDLVAIGDSHTYGVSVKSEESWPQALGRKSNKSVYNFGVGGYGLLQYNYLLDKAIALNPKHIIVGFYLFNDLADTCKIFHRLTYWQNWAKNNNINIQPCLDIFRKKTALTKNDPALKFLDLAKNIAILSALDNLFFDNQILVGNRLARNRALYHPESLQWENIYINDINLKTKINYLQIYNMAEFTDPHKDYVLFEIEMGKRIFKEMQRKCEKNGIQFSVLIITSKFEILYDYLVEQDIKLSDQYHRLSKNLRDIRKEFVSFFKESNIASFETEPYLKMALSGNQAVYSNSLDAHPIKAGYEAYAEAVYQGLFNKGSNKN